MSNPKYERNRWRAYNRPLHDLRTFVDDELALIESGAVTIQDRDSAHVRETLRRYVTKFVSFAIPTDEALDLIASHSPLLEVGAGNGYWAWRLRERGVDVVASEPDPDKPNPMIATLRADHRIVADYPTRSLLMVWPTAGDNWATDAVDLYKGDTVIYVGDPACEHTASGSFRPILHMNGFVLDDEIQLNSWPDVFRDTVSVFKR